MNIEIYIKTLSQDKDEDTDGPKFNERFIAMFNEVIVYDEGKERKYQIKLKDKLKVYEAKIKKLVSLFDVNNKGFITFANLRRIFEEIHLSLKETYIEYLIYKMKKYDSPENKLEDLKYDVIFNIIRDAEDDLGNEEGDESESVNDNDDNNNDTSDSHLYSVTNLQKSEIENLSPIEITTEQFNHKLNYIFTTLAKKLNELNQTVRQYFYLLVNSHEVKDEGIFEVIDLKEFITCLESLFQHQLDKLDSYCIFTKLKYLDKYQSIDINKLILIMKEYGIPEDKNESIDIQFIDKLLRFLKANNINIQELLSINPTTKTINYSDFINSLLKQGIINKLEIPQKVLDLIINNGNKDIIDIDKLNLLLTDFIKFKTGTFQVVDGSHILFGAEDTFSNDNENLNEVKEVKEESIEVSPATNKRELSYDHKVNDKEKEVKIEIKINKENSENKEDYDEDVFEKKSLNELDSINRIDELYAKKMSSNVDTDFDNGNDKQTQNIYHDENI